jgi:SAM-dependent methyltransferase
MGAPSAAPACRQCGAASVEDLGPIPDADLFAGQSLQPPWPGGRLHRCGRCQLTFRHPVREEAEYERLYATAPDTVWDAGAARVDHRLVRQRIAEERHARSVLDVGCYDGALLAGLPPGLERFGIEASRAAAQAARERGVTVVAERIGDIPSIDRRFDVVCAIDVIEHMVSPKDFLSLLAGLVAPGGLLLVSTGDADAPVWRAAGGRYWYCSFPEHLSFVCTRWAQAAAPACGLTLAGAEPFAYEALDPRALPRRRRRFQRQLAWARWRARLRPLLGTAGAVRPVGRPGLFDDHLLLAFRPAPR